MDTKRDAGHDSHRSVPVLLPYMRLLEITRASSLRLFASLLLVVVLAELGVMVILPFLMGTPRPGPSTVLADVFLLALLSAPVLWWLMVSPFKRSADEERQKSLALMETAPDAIFAIDTYGIVRLFNPTAERITGYRADQVLGRSLEVLMPAADDPAFDEHMRHLLQTGQPKLTGDVFETTMRRSDGQLRPVELAVSQIRLGGQLHYIGIARDISERRLAEEALRKSERQLREITAVLAEGIYVLDEKQRLTFMNPAAERMLGWSVDELLGKDPHAAFHFEDPSGSVVPLEECPVYLSTRSGQVYRNHEDHFVRKDGSSLPVTLVSAPVVRDGKVTGSVAAFHDITERLEAQRAVREQKERYQLLFNGARDAIFVFSVDKDGTPGRFVEVNDFACQRLGYSREELLAMGPADINAPEADVDLLMGRLMAERHVVAEREHVARDGRVIPVEINAHVLELHGQTVVMSMARDITDRKRAEERVQYLANHDPLTGLANRRLLMDRLELALAQARRHERRLAVLFVDLDGFKAVNDTLGHDAGDSLLRSVAERLRCCVRQGDTVARMGGDEFVILLNEINRPEDADAVASKIMAQIAEPLVLEGRQVGVTASVGISTWPEGGEDGAEGLIREADAAMYQAKQGGKGRHYRPHTGPA